MSGTLRRLRPRRSELLIRPIGNNGRFVVKDPKNGSYFQIGAQEQFLLSRLDGIQSAAMIRRAFEEEFRQPLTEDDLAQFLDMAAEQQLLAPADAPPPSPEFSPAAAALLGYAAPSSPRLAPRMPQPEPEKPAAQPATPATSAVPASSNPAGSPNVQSLLYWRKSLFDPDALFDRLLPWIGFLWTRTFLAVSLAMTFAAAWVVLANRADLISGFTGALRWESAALVWFTLLVVTTLHEFAHGLTLKRYGGQVKEIGVLVMYFIPCLFCNVSDAWLLRERSQRMLVTLAGGYCDLCLWAFSVFLWRLTPLQSLPNYLSFVAITVLGARVLFNFNPFLKLDGYYLLVDWFDVPNLLQRGQDRAKSHVRRLLWGADRPPADPNGLVLTMYGFASWGYGVVFLGVSVYAVTRLLWGMLGPAGIAFAVGLAALLIRSQLKDTVAGEWKAMMSHRKVRAAIVLLIAAAISWAATLPIMDRANGPFRIRPCGKFELRAPVTGIIRELHFDEGDDVPEGAVVARMEVPDLASQQARKRAEIAEAKARWELLVAGPNPATVAELTERAERARQWHALAEADLKRDRHAHTQDLARLAALVERTEAEVRQATSVRDRFKALLEQGAIAREEFDAADTRLAVCRGLRDQAHSERQAVTTRGTIVMETELARREKDWSDAKGALAVLKAGPRPEEIAAARAAKERAEEELRYLNEIEGRLIIRAGRPGVMTTARLRERIGRLFHEGDLICEVDDTRTLDAEILLREAQAARLAPGQSIEFLTRALPFQTFRGTVRKVAPAARRQMEMADPPTNGTTPPTTTSIDSEGYVVVHCTLNDSAKQLRPGMTGHARIYRGERAAGLVVTESAMRTIRIEFWR